MGEELHAQKGRQSLTSSQVVSGEPLPAFMPFWGHKYCQNWTTGPNLQYPEKSNNKFKKERAIFFFFLILDLLPGQRLLQDNPACLCSVTSGF